MTRFAYTVLVWCLLLGGCATVSATSQTPKEKPATSWRASLDVDHPGRLGLVESCSASR